MGSVTSGRFEDAAAAVHHGARHHEGVKAELVAGEHRFKAHGGRLPAQPVRGIQTWDRAGGEGGKSQGLDLSRPPTPEFSASLMAGN